MVDKGSRWVARSANVMPSASDFINMPDAVCSCASLSVYEIKDTALEQRDAWYVPF